MAEYPENSWEQLKSELNVRFAEVDDPIMFLPCNIMQGRPNMTLYRFMQKGCMLWDMMLLKK